MATFSGQPDMPYLVCTSQEFDDALCLVMSGDLDIADVAAFIGHLTKAVERSRNTVLDLSGIRYIDSSGIHALIDARRRFNAMGRNVVLAALSPWVERIFQTIAMDQVVPVFPTVEAALASFRDRMGKV